MRVVAEKISKLAEVTPQLEVNVMKLDDAVAEFVENRTIPIFGIANVQGFADALPGWHPKELMPKCESVVVFGYPLFQHPVFGTTQRS